ncbi:MAG: hypothetical protein P8L66_07610 [Rhodospirillaceae bacterium]|nr:hypothetical protein [Rhodospirillaceae bacterium]
MTVSQTDRPIHQALSITDNGILGVVWPDLMHLNSQGVSRYVFGNGSRYAVYVPSFLKSKSLYGPGLRGYVMPPECSVDVDTEEDLKLLSQYADTRATRSS